MIKITGLDQIIDKIENMQQSLPDKVKEIVNKLADIGVSVARVRFAQSIYDGTNDVIVETPQWVSENVLRINAVGESVAFIEFGAGLHYREERHPKENEFLFDRGSFGSHQGLYDYWYYRGEPGTNGEIVDHIPKLNRKFMPKKTAIQKNGKYLVKTHGNPANRCLYDSAKEMRQRIYEIAREVMQS